MADAATSTPDASEEELEVERACRCTACQVPGMAFYEAERAYDRMARAYHAAGLASLPDAVAASREVEL